MFFIVACCFSLIASEVLAYEKDIVNGTVEPVIEGNKREIYVYEQTIVIRDLLPEGKVGRCDLMNTGLGVEQPTIKEIMEFFSPETVQQIEIRELHKIIASCDAIDEPTPTKYWLDKLKPYAKLAKLFVALYSASQSLPDELATVTRDISGGLVKAWKNIYPRTKWCGRGNVAKSYHDLGELRNLDRCCRTHDFCPIKIPGNGEMYGLKNDKDYTTSHCMCDATFYNCLEKTNEILAGQIGFLYFSYLKPNCIRGFPHINSVDHESNDNVMRLVPVEKSWYGGQHGNHTFTNNTSGFMF